MCVRVLCVCASIRRHNCRFKRYERVWERGACGDGENIEVISFGLRKLLKVKILYEK